jgi:hypothetical protein
VTGKWADPSCRIRPGSVALSRRWVTLGHKQGTQVPCCKLSIFIPGMDIFHVRIADFLLGSGHFEPPWSGLTILKST